MAISCCVFKCGRLNLAMLKTKPHFALFEPPSPSCENYGNGGRYLCTNCLLKLYLRPNLWSAFDGHPLRVCGARWIDKKEKKERKKEGSWVKLKAFPTNVGRPNHKTQQLRMHCNLRPPEATSVFSALITTP